jgi:hypothetical protein
LATRPTQGVQVDGQQASSLRVADELPGLADSAANLRGEDLDSNDAALGECAEFDLDQQFAKIVRHDSPFPRWQRDAGHRAPNQVKFIPPLEEQRLLSGGGRPSSHP